MEKIEIINANSNFNKEIKDNASLHKEICVFVVNDKGQVLLQKRSSNKKYYPNKWALLTGHVKIGENFEAAAIRELKEEIGISINKANLFARRIFTNDDINYDVTYIYYIKCNLSGKDFIIQKEELSEVKWVNIDEVISMINNHDEKLILGESRIKLFEFIKKLND